MSINYTKQAAVTVGYNSQVYCVTENTLILRFNTKKMQYKYTDTSILEH